MVVDEPKSLGQRIRLAREDRGLSVQQLAAQAGCSDEYLEWVEDGQTEPPVALLLQLAKGMQLDAATFLRDYDSSAQRLEEAAKRAAHEGVGYRHEGEEFVYVVSGEVEVTVDKDKKTFQKAVSPI
ncbi:MAG: XRE family transcriptional regulator [Desulfobacteraceae bacterium]|jgi:transcriptional regulator with XRE-family HTH domain